MEIKINVDETMFKDVIENELNAFSKEELHSIIRDFIIETLKTDKNVKNLFYVERCDRWGHTSIDPSELLKSAAKNIDLSPSFNEIQDNMIKTLKENYHELLEKVMLQMIMSGISNNYEFQSKMASSIESIINFRKNNSC